MSRSCGAVLHSGTTRRTCLLRSSKPSLISALMLMAIPILMILLSTTLPARANRTLNLVVASLYIPVSMFNAVGESK